jgi:hypothetical protein
MTTAAMLVAAAALAHGVAAPAPTSFDQTITCGVPVRAGIPVMDFDASPKGWTFTNGKREPKPATLTLQSLTLGPAPPSVTYLWVTSARRTWGTAKPPTCTRAAPMPITRAGLPFYDTARGVRDISFRCFAGTQMTARVQAVVSHGVATSARLLVRTGKTSRPLIYVDWTPTKISVYATDDCN